MKKIFFVLILALGYSSVGSADWSCDCKVSNGDVWVVDGSDEKDAKLACTEEAGGTVLECQSQGRGDRTPSFLGESVRVPANPGGVDVCRDYIAYHKKIDSLEITLNGRTPENMRFMHNGKVVGTMIYNDDGSEAAVCTVL